MNIEKLYELFLESTGLTTDSRNIAPGNIFLALSGENFNGNVFAADALKKGCTFAIIDDESYASGSQYFLVDNCLRALQSLASYHRLKMGVPMLAITGTNGKTTTKELIAQVLKRKFNLIYTQGNLNNHIGVPLTLLKIKKDTEFSVIEMGANHPGEIALLCDIAKPDYGLITNIGKAHLEGFGGFEGVINTKNELYKHLSATQGTIFYNTDNKILTDLLKGSHARLISYGTRENADFIGESISADPFLQIHFQEAGVIQTQLAGIYNFENALAAASIGSFLGVPDAEIKNALEEYTPSNQRSQIKQSGKNQLVMDFYNANPSSMEAALLNFEGMTAPRKAVILGDMLELGVDTEPEHANIIDRLKQMKLEKVFLVGKSFYTLSPGKEFLCFENADQLKIWLTDNPIQSCLILIKGSRGIKLETVVEML